MDVYEIVTSKIIEKLEKGVVPWHKPWKESGAVNWRSQKPYQGINSLLLEDGEYASKKQILESGGWIKKEELKNYSIVVYWLWKEKRDKETDEIIQKFAKPFYYKVWEINTQVEGLQSKRKEEIYNHNPIEKAEEIFKGYINCPSYTFQSGQAAYYPTLDRLNCPPIKDFKVPEEYYSTLFHEMIHSTGHSSRLKRQGIATGVLKFGSETYSKEELVAEIGATMLCGVAGIENKTIDNSASYIQSWLNALKNDKKLIIHASAQAQKASNYILGIDQA